MEDRRRWEGMVETRHPQGWCRSPGGQIRTWVRSRHCGVLGGIGFTAAGMQLGPRDGFVGWSDDVRVANIGKVVCNHRFILLRGVRVKGLASRARRLATQRIADDWAAAYGERPVLTQTFTGPGMSGLSCEVSGMEVLPGSDLGAAFGCASRGLAEAALRRLARGPVPRTETSSRLVRAAVR